MENIFHTNKQIDLYSKASLISSAFKFYYNPLKTISKEDFKTAKQIIEGWELEHSTNTYSIFKNDAILVGYLSYRLGEVLGLKKKELSNLYISALVQGIGKLYACGGDKEMAYKCFTSPLRKGDEGFDQIKRAIKKYPSETLKYLTENTKLNSDIISTSTSYHSVHSNLFASGYPNVDTDITQLDSILWFANSLSAISFASEELLKRNYREGKYVSIIEALEILREQTSEKVPNIWGTLSNATLVGFIFALSFGINPSSRVQAANYNPDEVVALVNEYRNKKGLDSLTVDEKLVEAARLKAQDMLNKDYWDHYGPNGESPWNFIHDTGYEYNKAGENLAKGYSDVYRMNQAWLDSPTHERNISNKKFTEIGVAVVDGKLGGKNVTLVVQLFANEKKTSVGDNYKKMVTSVKDFLLKVTSPIMAKK